MNILIHSLEFLVILFLVYYILRIDKKKSFDKLKEEYFVLEKLKPMPKYSDVDTNSQLVINLIDTAELEKWGNPSIDIGSTYTEFDISNTLNNINISCRLYTKNDSVKMDRLVIGKSYKKIYIDSDALKPLHVRTKVLKYVWRHMLEDNHNKYEREFKRIMEIKQQIEKELVAINRNKTLEQILNS